MEGKKVVQDSSLRSELQANRGFIKNQKQFCKFHHSSNVIKRKILTISIFKLCRQYRHNL